LTTQRIDNKVRKCVWEIAQFMSIINKQGAGPEGWDLLIDQCVTRISDQGSKRPLWKWYMAEKTNLDGQKLKPALDEFSEVGLYRSNDQLEETPTTKSKLMHIGMYFVALMVLLFFFMMCRYRKRQVRYLGSQVFAGQGALRRLDQFLSCAI